jgi:hypothetical protein
MGGATRIVLMAFRLYFVYLFVGKFACVYVHSVSQLPRIEVFSC